MNRPEIRFQIERINMTNIITSQEEMIRLKEYEDLMKMENKKKPLKKIEKKAD